MVIIVTMECFTFARIPNSLFKLQQWHIRYMGIGLSNRHVYVAFTIQCSLHTGWSKKAVPQFYFCDNFCKCTPIL